MTTGDQKVALVLSGGGANGAYEVGVLKALMSGRCAATGYRPLAPDIVTGTSAGALNAALLASYWDEYGPAAAGRLERFWLDRMAGGTRANGVYRLRGNPFELLDPASYLAPLELARRLLADGAYLAWEGLQRAVSFAAAVPEGSPERLLLGLLDPRVFISLAPFERTVQELDYQAIQSSSLFVKVAAVNWATGDLRVFWNHDMTGAFGPVVLRAAIAVPGLLPAVEYGAQAFVDGSILLNTPLSLAIHAGADVLHVVYLDPDVANIPLAGKMDAFGTIFRIFQIGWAAQYRDDIGDAEAINQRLAAFERLKASLSVEGAAADTLRDALQLRPPPGSGPLRPLTIYRYHPRDPLPGRVSFLNFDRERVETLIERGFQDAVHHEPERSHDVIADPRGGAETAPVAGPPR